jgi:predicted RNA-binding Zn-ribbon protein involved in translation (DUF1610 family)
MLVETSLPQTILNCTQCGGELHPDEGQIFLTCPFCNSTVYLDKSRVVFHWYVSPTLDEPQARGALARWMSGNQTVKDLDQKARVTEASFSFFPLWYFKLRNSAGRQEIALRPAAATAVSEIRNLRLPAGDLRRFADQVGGQATAPSVPLQAALEWVKQSGAVQNEVLEQSLVHIPLHTFKYAYRGTLYTAIVEGATGEVFANIFPAKAEAPYLLAGGLSALVFLCLALFPIVGALSGEGAGAGLGLLLCGGIGLAAGLGLFALAAWVAAKI